MSHRLRGWVLLAAVGYAVSGCYTVLRAPGVLSSTPDETPAYVVDDRYDDYDHYGDEPGIVYEDSSVETLLEDRDYGQGYPLTGYSSPYGLYGFGSPFAYGPGLGYSYSYGRYAPVYGPYGYGYDPYYYDPYGYSRAGGTYVPPGYELVTRRELDELRLAREASGTTDGGDLPRVSQQELQRQREREAQRVWTQRSTATRPSSSGFRTPKTTSTSSSTPTVSSTSAAKPKSSSSSSSSSGKSSGSSAASKRSKRGR